MMNKQRQQKTAIGCASKKRKNTGQTRRGLSTGWLGLLGISAVVISLTLAGVNADKIFELANWAVHAIIAWALYGKGGKRRD